MNPLYLWINALMYAAFAVWCTVSYAQTSQAAGYLSLDASGRSEYLVVYGGLQLGLAIFYAYLASHADLHRLGIIFSVSIYACIVVYRMSTLTLFWPVSRVTLAVAILEIILLLAALALFFLSRTKPA